MEPVVVLKTMAEVSEMTNGVVPVATLRYWRHLGKGPRSARIGSRIMYREKDVIAWINEQFEASNAK